MEALTNLANLLRLSSRDGLRLIQNARKAIAKESGTTQLDALVSAIAQVAGGKVDPEVAAEVVLEARALEKVLQRKLSSDSWQSRTLWVSLAQLSEIAGQLTESARAWMHVAAIAPHRAFDAQNQARALFVRAEAFDEWLSLRGSSMPRTGDRYRLAKTAVQRSVLTSAVPLLEPFFEETRGPDTLLMAGIDWETLDALEQAGCAPGAKAFLKALPFDDFDDGPTFDGALVLPPRPDAGFIIKGVNCKQSKKAKAFLAQATSVVRRFDRLIATWGAPASALETESHQPIFDTAGLSRSQASFVRDVGEKLRDHLSESGGEVWRFEGAPWSTIDALAKVLGEAFLDAQASDAPSHRVLLQKTAPSRKNTHFGGHVVWPPRADFRVSLTSVTTPAKRVLPGWKKTADEVVKTGQRLYLWWD